MEKYTIQKNYLCSIFMDYAPPIHVKTLTLPDSTREKCVNAASRHFRINKMVIDSIIDVEGGKIGTVSKNSNGSFDLGIMQINTIHLSNIKKHFPTVDATDLVYKPCINIAIGTWILSERLKETDSFWIGVGNYHSKTPKYRTRYLQKIFAAFKKRVEKTRHIKA